MEQYIGPVERAFQLVENGQCQSVEEIRRFLKNEGYSDSHICGPSLLRHLRHMMRAHQRRRRGEGI
jgi:hypothetical protein